MIVRKAEMDAVVALLESDDYEDAPQLAKAIVSKVAEMLQERDTFGVSIRMRTDEFSFASGPYFTQREADKAVRQAEDAGLIAFRAKLFSPTKAGASDVHSAVIPCVCGHSKVQHFDQGRCGTFHPSFTGPKAAKRPHWPQCPCKAYEKEVS